jgi:beta-lactam-binding protein with PASTA domain
MPVAFPPLPTTTTTLPPFVEREPPSPLGPATGVPNVVGKSVEEATAILNGAGFAVRTVPAPTGTKPPGVVTVQSPFGGSSAPRGTTVTLEVSAGQPAEPKPKPKPD